MKNKVLVVGSGSITESIVSKLEKVMKDDEIIVADKTANIDDFRDAIPYRNQPRLPDNIDFNRKYKRVLSSSINIDKEYQLILQKNSNLSKWERDEVVRIYTNNDKASNK